MKPRELLHAAALSLALGAQSYAAGYPERIVTVVVPFPAGGSSDTTARLTTQKMQETFGQAIVLENKAGANGAIGAAQVARAKPDGYMLLVGSIGIYAINPVLYKNLPYDPVRDFDLLTLAVRTPNALVASPNFPADNVRELIAYLKQNPDKVTFASSGVGSSDHLTAALFWQKTGTSGLHVPYKGGAPAQTDLMGGHVDLSFQNLGAVASYVASGKMKLLAVTGETRAETFPDTPTLKEAGVEGIEVYSWQAFAAPKGLSAEVKGTLERSLRTALSAPDVKSKFRETGFEVVASTSEEFSRFLNQELGRWKSVVEAGKITAD